MTTNIEKSQIKALLTAPGWMVAERIAQEVCDQIASEPKIKDTEWETAKAVVFDEGQKAGIKRFLQELFNTQQ